MVWVFLRLKGAGGGGRVFSTPLKKVFIDKGGKQEHLNGQAQLMWVRSHLNTRPRAQLHPDTRPQPWPCPGRSSGPHTKAGPQVAPPNQATAPAAPPDQATAVPLTPSLGRSRAPLRLTLRYLLAVLLVPHEAHLPVAALPHGSEEAVGSQGHPPAARARSVPGGRRLRCPPARQRGRRCHRDP